MSASSSQSREHTERPTVVLFHSVLGLRPAVHRFADALRRDGYVVHLPDLYEGVVFDDYESAGEYLAAIGGIETLMARTLAAVEHLPTDVVYAGFSNGGGSAEYLAITRAGARGAILMHAALPVQAFGCDAWPSAVPVQVHYAVGDPFRDEGAIATLADQVRESGAAFTLVDYPAHGHLFADDDLPDEFDATSAAQLHARVASFLRTSWP